MVDQDSQFSDFSLREGIWRLLQDKPHWRRNLEEMVLWEETTASPAGDLGWDRRQVFTSAHITNVLNNEGIIVLSYHSGKYTNYRLKSLAVTKEALTSLLSPAQGSGEAEGRREIDHSQLFGTVVGHDNIKVQIRNALEADRPVHCLLVGVEAAVSRRFGGGVGFFAVDQGTGDPP